MGAATPDWKMDGEWRGQDLLPQFSGYLKPDWQGEEEEEA